MKNVLILGAGLVSRPIVSYLLARTGCRVVVATRRVERAERLVQSHPRGEARQLDLDDTEALERYIRVGRPDLLHDPKQRALFLTRLGGGAGITHVQRILGHSQITTTAQYAKDCAGAIEKKHPREKEYRRKK